MESYPRHVFLLTDGCVSNTAAVVRLVEKSNKFSRVHTIGVGDGCSEELIKGCAKKGKGHHVFIKNDDNCSEKIVQLLTDSLSPMLTQIKLSFDHELVESIIPNPESMPYILKDELINFYVTFKGQLDASTQFCLSYEDSLNKLPYSSEIGIDPSS